MPNKGYKQSREHRMKVKKKQLGLIPWNFGKVGVYTKETLEKMRIGNLGKMKEKVEIATVHLWLNLTFKKPKKCERCGKKHQRIEWSLLKGKNYERIRNNFWAICKKCHIEYDDVLRRSWITRKQKITK